MLGNFVSPQTKSLTYTRSSASDILTSLRRHHLWLRMGARDLVLEHARAALGILWPIIGALAWISIIYLFLGEALGQGDPTYLAYLTIGIVTYNYASGILVSGVQCFQMFKGLILNIPNPLFIYPLRLTVKVAAGVGFQLLFIVAALMICGIKPSIYWFWLIPGLVAYLVTGAFLTLIMGMIGVWIGDLRFMMQSIMRMMMFATPIFWYPPESGARFMAMQLNPLAHYIEFIRDPLLGNPVKPVTVAVVFSITAFCVIFGTYLFQRSRNDIVRKL